MKKSYITVTTISLLLSACSSIGSPQFNGRIASETFGDLQNPASLPAFSYAVSQKRFLQTEADDTVIDAAGKDVSVKSKQVIVSLKHESDITPVLKKYGAKVIEQMIIHGPSKVTRKSDGTTIVEAPSTVKRLPNFLLEIDTTRPVDFDHIKKLADKHGLRGHLVFKNLNDASLLQTALEMQDDQALNIKGAELNIQGKPASYTPEGYPWYSNPPQYESAPNSTDFWWVGHPDPGSYGTGLNPGYDLPVWNYASGSGVKVAILDQGFCASGTVMSAYIIGSTYWTYAPTTLAADNDISGIGTQQAPYHGRRVASLLFAPNSDDGGTVGSAPGATKLLCKTDYGSWNNEYCLEAAIGWGAKVINMSYGYPNLAWGNSPDAGTMSDAANNGVILVAAAGNDGGYWDNFYPACQPYVISVGSTGKDGSRAVWDSSHSSNYAKVDIWCAGSALTTAAGFDSPAYQMDPNQVGTSLSTPIVTGVIADVVQLHPDYNYDLAKTRIRNYGANYPLGPEIQGHCDNIGLNALLAVRGY